MKMASFDTDYPALTDFSLEDSTVDVKTAVDLQLANSKPRIKEFLTTLGRVRRVLANVATYMTFDDHEVTDDWFMDEDWRSEALSNAGATQVIRNGLLAFCLFQRWGNVPDDLRLGSTGSSFAPLSLANTMGTGASVPNDQILPAL